MRPLTSPVPAGLSPSRPRGAARRGTPFARAARPIALMLIVMLLVAPVATRASDPAATLPPAPGGRQTPDAQPALDAELMNSVIGAALAFLTPRTLDSHSAREFCLWGLNGLGAIDPSLGVNAQAGQVRLSLGQDTLLALPAPPDTDQTGWTALAVRLMQAAWARSAPMRDAGADGTLQGFFDELFNHMDPYSRYVAPSPATTDRDSRTGGTAGAGLTLGHDARSILITGVNANGPAWAEGLSSGQRIYAVNGRSTRDQTPATVSQWLLGEVGSKVTLLVGDERTRRTVVLHRASVPPETVFAYASNHTIVIRVTAFSADTAEEMSQYLDQASDDPHLRGLVLDLRGNRGGVLQQAVTTSALMLDRGVAAITHGRDPQANHIWAVQGGDMTGGAPIVILVDGRTASAAEILAAALADHRRAVVVGSATLGKGLVQTIGQMPDGGELFVTWSRVLAPQGWPLQGLGVMPQICTSRGEADLERQLQDLAGGTVDMRDAVQAARAARFPLPVSRILDIRKACPAAIGTDSDLDAARSLIDNPAEYRAALTAIPDDIAYAPQAE
ncbi:PDZ domain-containing protein [Gluconacetobacter azotocaptans]|uniref:PDZ domain-containing protein n=1 Tax=Gluconacetobacter azotocaptans TaxID=142834 RepID=A0A7W4JV77_9PROT|nr:S41 family peptidase [Gluconacetobacter azotocaptans]MBB2191522.1 PDZ domain-containing protein [Gluconacetobacter azotocaptans]